MSSLTILCLLVLAELILGRPVEHLLGKFIHVDWKEMFAQLIGKDCKNLKEYATHAGRTASKPLVTFYYVIRDEQTTLTERILIFAAIAYVLSPGLLSKQVFRILGFLDDSIAIAFVLNKVADKITPEINNRVEETLDSWFGAEYVLAE